jgi:hypothetical protein
VPRQRETFAAGPAVGEFRAMSKLTLLRWHILLKKKKRVSPRIGGALVVVKMSTTILILLIGIGRRTNAIGAS